MEENNDCTKCGNDNALLKLTKNQKEPQQSVGFCVNTKRL